MERGQHTRLGPACAVALGVPLLGSALHTSPLHSTPLTPLHAALLSRGHRSLRQLSVPFSRPPLCRALHAHASHPRGRYALATVASSPPPTRCRCLSVRQLTASDCLCVRPLLVGRTGVRSIPTASMRGPKCWKMEAPTCSNVRQSIHPSLHPPSSQSHAISARSRSAACTPACLLALVSLFSLVSFCLSISVSLQGERLPCHSSISASSAPSSAIVVGCCCWLTVARAAAAAAGLLCWRW